MANVVDSLLARVADDDLRHALASEVRRLLQTTDFGLVFERHLPETARLLTHPIRRGFSVQDRADADSPTWLVRRVAEEVARLVSAEGEESERPIDDLVVVRDSLIRSTQV